MDGDSWISLLLIFVLLLMGAYFAASEIALSSVNRVRIRLLAEKKVKSAKNVQYILDHFDEALSTILIGNNLSHILSSSIATVLATRLWGRNSVAAVTLILTVIVFFFAELLPKNIAKKYAEHFSQAIAGSLIVIMHIFSFFARMLTAIGNAAARLFGDGGGNVTEDEFHNIVENIAEEGNLKDGKGELVQSVLHFDAHTVADVLTVRVDMQAIDDSDSVDEILEQIRDVHHSRLPVYHDSIDNVIGILSCRKYIKAYLTDREQLDLKKLMDPPFFVHASTEIADLLPILNEQAANMAIVTDDYGGIAGLVTVEDILEELVGDIWDEDDVVVENFKQVDDHTWDVNASLRVEECFGLMGYENYEKSDFAHKSMASLAYASFDSIPREGDHFRFQDLTITILKMEKRRILAMRIERQESGVSAV